MPYKRKTEDVYEVQGNYGYGHGWEYLCGEKSRREANQRLKEYRENENVGSHRVVRRRWKVKQ
jgi:hypothetical protein